MKAAFGVLILAFASTAAAAPPRVEPGLWLIRTVVTNDGVTEPAEEEKVCATADEVRDLERYFMPTPGNLPGRCTASRERAKPDALAFRMRCSAKDLSVDMRATITFPSAERYLLDARSDARQRGKASVAFTKAEARRIGPCPQ
jgi:hypothetical protein